MATEKPLKKLDRNCQLCELRGKTTTAHWDAKTLQGPWAYLCNEHMRLGAHPGFREVATRIHEEGVTPR